MIAFLHPPFHQCPLGMGRQLFVDSSLFCPSSPYFNGSSRSWPYNKISRLTIKGRMLSETWWFMRQHRLGRTRVVRGALLVQILRCCATGRRRRQPLCLKNSTTTHWTSTSMVRQLIRFAFARWSHILSLFDSVQLGTDIYVYFTLFYNEGNQITVNTECNFTVDNGDRVFFNHSGDPTRTLHSRDYNSLVYSRTDLTPGKHHMTISMSDVSYHVFLSFDYAVYTWVLIFPPFWIRNFSFMSLVLIHRPLSQGVHLQ